MEKFYAKKIEEFSYDPIRAIEETMTITSSPSLRKREIPFFLFDQQKDMIQHIDYTDRSFIVKSRQTGVTSCVLAYLTAKGLFSNKGLQIGVMCNRLDQSVKQLRMVKKFAETNRMLPLIENDGYDIFKTDSLREMKFRHNNTSIIAFSSTSDALRGYHLDYLLIDEAVFIDGLQYESIYPSVKKLIVVSTPDYSESNTYGLEPAFFKTLTPFKMHWYLDPRFNSDLEWYVPGKCVLYQETKFTKQSIQMALDLGLKPTSTWFRSMSASLGHNEKRINAELNML